MTSQQTKCDKSIISFMEVMRCVTLKCLHHKNYDGTLVAVTATQQSAVSTSVCEGFQHQAADPSYPD